MPALLLGRWRQCLVPGLQLAVRLCQAAAGDQMPLTMALACKEARQQAAGLETMACLDLASGTCLQSHFTQTHYMVQYSELLLGFTYMSALFVACWLQCLKSGLQLAIVYAKQQLVARCP